MDPGPELEGEFRTSVPRIGRPIYWREKLAGTSVGTRFVLPAGTATLLLADIEGSTRLWERDPTLMQEALGRFDQIVDTAIAKHGGVRPRDQGEGDSFLAAFARASDALACAQTLQTTLFSEEWKRFSVRVRIGIHSAEVQLRDEGNYVGQTINRAARIRDAGHGGQTLISQTVRDLALERLPPGAFLRDLGSHRLRDLSRPEHIFQLCHPELPQDFPELRTLDRWRHNLPVLLTSFVGRSKELSELRGLMSQTRLLSLTGSGGSGKTRLALQHAAEVLDKFPEGAWFVDLASLQSTGQVVDAIAAALGFMAERGRPQSLQNVLEPLQNGPSLLILDNCEHIVGICAELVDSLLKSCPDLKIIVTSREALQVPGETVWRVPSLSLPDEQGHVEVGSLTQYEAVQLFVERAIKSRPNFKINNENAAAVAEICHRLDGIPLAIELAAARVRLLSPHEITQGLSDRFHLLTGGGRTAMPRQQTLQASVEWSYGLLNEIEQLLLRRLSVFAGSFSLDAAEEVCSDDAIPRREVLDVLTQLVDKSLVDVEARDSGTRYRLLETVRQYARDRSIDLEEEAVIRGRHASFFADLTENAHRRFYGVDWYGWRDEIAPDVQNLRAAMEWSKAQADGLRLLRLVTNSVGWVPMEVREWTDWLEEALRLVGDATPELVARAEEMFVDSYLWSERFEELPTVANQALARFRKLGFDHGIATCLMDLGVTTSLTGDLEEASRMLEEARTLAEKAADPWLRSEILRFQGVVHAPVDVTRAAAALAEAVSLAHASKVPADSAEMLLAGVLALKGEVRDAATLYDEVMSRGSSPSPAFQLWLVSALVAVGRFQEAKELAQKRRHFHRTGQRRQSESMAIRMLAQLATLEGRYEEAISLFEEADRVFPATTTPRRERSMIAASIPLYLAGRKEEAQSRIDAAIRRLRESSAADLAWGLLFQAAVNAMDDEFDRALEAILEALPSAEQLGHRGLVFEYLRMLASVAARKGAYADAGRFWGASRTLKEELGHAGTSWLLPDEIGIEKTVEEARVTHDSEPFEAAVEEGRKMSVDEAIAYARRGRGSRKRPLRGWASLTPMEMQVAKLVAEGLSNPKIAERLFISRRTVQTHLTRIFAKLDMSNRAELAAEAVRQISRGP